MDLSERLAKTHERAASFASQLCVMVSDLDADICQPSLWLLLGSVCLESDQWYIYRSWLEAKLQLPIPSSVPTAIDLEELSSTASLIEYPSTGKTAYLHELAKRQLSNGLWQTTLDDTKEHIATTCRCLGVLLDDYPGCYGADMSSAGKQVQRFLIQNSNAELEWKLALALKSLSRLCRLNMLPVDCWMELTEHIINVIAVGQLASGGFRFFLPLRRELPIYEPQAGIVETCIVLGSLCSMSLPIPLRSLIVARNIAHKATLFLIENQRPAGDWPAQGLVDYLSTLTMSIKTIRTVLKSPQLIK